MTNKILAIILALLLCAVVATAEETTGTQIDCLIEEGSFIIQIDDPEGDMGWVADDMAQDDTVVKLYDTDLIEDTFVVRYDPVGDGDVTVAVRHYTGIACDELHTFDLHVENGAVTESTGGSYAASPDPAESDPYLIGEWQTEDGMSAMTIAKNPDGKAWDVDIATAGSHGATVFKTTIYFDCELNCFVYDKGKYWEAPITDSEEEPELGEAKIAGTTGSFTFTGDPENLILEWYDDQMEGETVAFTRTEASVE